MSDEQTMIDPENEEGYEWVLSDIPKSMYEEVSKIAATYGIYPEHVFASAWYALAEPGCEKAVAEFNEWLRWHQTQRGNNNG